MTKKVTISIIKCDDGSLAGHHIAARLSAEEMEYTTIQQVLQKLEKCFTPLDES